MLKMNGRKPNPGTRQTMLMLAPGESKTYGLKFFLADVIRNIESTLVANHRPVWWRTSVRPAGWNIDALTF